MCALIIYTFQDNITVDHTDGIRNSSSYKLVADGQPSGYIFCSLYYPFMFIFFLGKRDIPQQIFITKNK